MNNIDDILQRLQAAEQPVIDNPDELTERIMKGLDSKVTTPSLTGRVRGGSLLIIRTVLSLAALWIIGFFIYLQFESATPVVQEALPERGTGASTLKDIYKDYLCQDCKKTVSYSQLRNKLYENK